MQPTKVSAYGDPAFRMKPPGMFPSDDSDYSKIELQFERLADAETPEQRQERRRQIIVTCLPLADRIADRYAGRGEPSDDLIQVARIGLIKAIDRYDPAKGSFVSLAFILILGELRRHFRDNAWGMHVPRGIKDTHRRVRAAIEPLSQRLGRIPTASELAAELGVGRDVVSISMWAENAYHPKSFDERIWASGSDEDAVGSHLGADDPRYNAVEDAVAVARSIARLPERHQVILKMRFYECLTQAQIAQYFGISRVHVSRRLNTALGCLRAQLSDKPGRREMLI
ncbi:sigma-70 family RNA polymerase sigma factor [Mycobacterium sp. 852002-51971_SCH5477799-a]|uniref:sigma-70 family RNA polymerase sigma factor n=1 Tax=Mycobacterium sp. 852002-51971_SCH5477799-a TaxID=1834106 RepID=UPI000A50A090|nr:sigma-70 family RNA polymerase sigma factor [Mycobacterium sp. 852002-51971_SCH5477799-a]